MKVRSFAAHGYRRVRNIVWASPLARWPAAADVAVRFGFWARRWLRLVPPRETVAYARGHWMWFDGGSECYLDMTQGTWEPGVVSLFETMLAPGMAVVDVGAHIGYFSLLAAKQVEPLGRVFAFEPAPGNYDLLVRNIRLNGYRNIIPVQKAVSNREGKSPLFLHPGAVAHTLFANTFGKPDSTIEVETITLDRFFAVEGWPTVHLVKLDIEGAEPAALEGMAELLIRNPRIWLIVEFIPHILARAGTPPRRFVARLGELGFRIRLIRDDCSLVDFDERLADNLQLRAELWCERDRYATQ